MIVEQRTYTIAPGKVPGFLAAYEEFGLPVHRDIYQRLVGYYVAESGVLNQVVQLWEFDDLEERARRRAAVQADPRWVKYMQQVSGMVLQQESRLLSPARWSPPAHFLPKS